MQTVTRIIITTSVLIFGASGWAQTSITPSQPTHYFYTPMAKVDPPNHLVLGSFMKYHSACRRTFKFRPRLWTTSEDEYRRKVWI